MLAQLHRFMRPTAQGNVMIDQAVARPVSWLRRCLRLLLALFKIYQIVENRCPES